MIRSKRTKKSETLFQLVIISIAIDQMLCLDTRSTWSDVSLDEEIDEQNKVRGIHKESVADRAGPDIAVVPLRELIVCIVDDKDPSNHLDDLQTCDRHGDPFGGLDADRAQGKVEVHAGMYHEVDRHEVPSERCTLCRRHPREEQDRDVVIDVQEDEWSFSHDDQDGVSQLHQLGQGKHTDPEAAQFAGSCHADRAVEVVVGQDVSHVLRQSECTQQAEDSQAHVPCEQKPLEFEWLPIRHPLLAVVNDSKVSDRRHDGDRHVVLQPLSFHLKSWAILEW